MWYYILNDENKIAIFDTDFNRLHDTLAFMSDYSGSEILESEVEIVAYNGNKYFVTDEEYIAMMTAERQADFEGQFFNIPNYGWFRKKPKGYSSAVESLNTAFNAVTVMQQLPAGMLIFYQQPDYSIPEQCTEEWLVEHQILSPAMTAQEFGQFYIAFMTAWNNQEHVNEVEE